MSADPSRANTSREQRDLRILLADDHAMVRDGLKGYIQLVEPNTEIVEADSFESAAAVLAAEDPVSLIILDLNMPGMNRLDGLDRLRGAYPEIPVVILSGSIEHQDIVDALDRGAAGYFPKTMGGRALTNALRLVLAGERYVPSAILESDFPGAPPAADGPADAGVLDALSEREMDVLRLLARGKSNKEVARDLDLQEPTVKTHVTAVFRKLGVSNRTAAAREAFRLGIE